MLVTDVVTGKYIEEAQQLKLQPAKYFKPLRSYGVHKIWLTHSFRGDN